MPDRSRPSMTIVLPAYQEAGRLEPALDELFHYLHGAPPEGDPDGLGSGFGAWDVLVVDDGSTDATADLVEARPEASPSADGAPPRLRVLRRAHAGKGAAVRAGMLAATGDLVVFTDADMATPPDQLPLLTEALADHDVALGSRVQPDGSDRRGEPARASPVAGRCSVLLAGAWVTGSVPDTQCGFKGFRARGRPRPVRAPADHQHRLRRRDHPPRAEAGVPLAIVPVHWSDKRGSRMRVRPALALRVAWDLLRIPVIHRGVPRVAAVADESSTRPEIALRRSLAPATPIGGSTFTPSSAYTARRPDDHDFPPPHRRAGAAGSLTCRGPAL